MLSVQREDSPDYELMQQIVDHLSNPIGTYHYPVEEQLLSEFSQAMPHKALCADVLKEQHAQLLRQGKELCATILLILEEQWVLREDFLDKGLGYLQAYQAHMNNEKHLLFPIAAANTDHPYLHSSGSIYSFENESRQQAESEFEAIKDRLVAEGAGAWPWKSANHQHCAVCG